MQPTAWSMATALFERIYSTHPGTESEAFAAAKDAVAPFIPALREEGFILAGNRRKE